MLHSTGFSHIKQIGGMFINRNQIIKEVKVRLHHLIFFKFLTIFFMDTV